MSDWWIDETPPIETWSGSESIRLSRHGVIQTDIERIWYVNDEAVITKITTRENMQYVWDQIDLYEGCDVIVGTQFIGVLVNIEYNAIPSPNSTPFNRIMTTYHRVVAILRSEDKERI